MMGFLASILAAAGALAPVSAIIIDRLGAGRGVHTRNVESYTFEDFVTRFNRSYAAGSEEWARREHLFETRKQEVLNFLTGPPQPWTMGITQFVDYTDAEYRAMLGYKGRRSASASGAAFARDRKYTHPPVYTTRSDSRKLGELVRDQGGCGSCWAEAATAALEGQMESNATIMADLRKVLDSMGKTTQAPTLSSQAMVSRTKNERNCGGSGGCDGATVELAYDMVKQRGIPMAVEWSYVSGYGQTPECKDSVFKASVTLGITGYEVLPSNKLHPLMQALYDSGGPIAVSVDATHWGLYSGGIYSDTSRGDRKGDFTVNHAVTLMAYRAPHKGLDGKELDGYWQIKNSWGQSWGEKGYIRLEMKKEEEAHCGMDHDTHQGLACDGDPDEAWVCGTCGVLYDSSYATGLHLINN